MKLINFTITVVFLNASYCYQVVILGAGAAGISAAKTLTEMGIHDFLVIDAQPFIGGRVQHTQFGQSQVELGANWIYGKGKNPIYKLANQHDLKTVPNDKTNLVFFDDQDGSVLNQTEGHEIYNQFDSVKTKLATYAEKRMARHQVDISSRSALSIIDWRPDTPLKSAIEYFHINWEFAESPEMCSLEYATGTVDAGSYPFGNEFVLDSRGFNHILHQEAKAISNIWLNTTVQQVMYDDHGIKLMTDAGPVYANYAICTFSLGVLQSDHVQFIPSFPEWKKEALLSFHMTTYTKIFIKFKQKFWGDWQFALYASRVTPYYTVWQNLNAPGYLQQDNILMVTVTEHESHRIEAMSNTDIQCELTQVLHTMFPNTTFEIQDILLPRWHANPLFKGSYSNWPIGALKKHHNNMRAPLQKLWFAGEAMSLSYFGFLHGAWLEGIQVAKSVTQCLTGKCQRVVFDEYVSGCDEKPRFVRQQFYA